MKRKKYILTTNHTNTTNLMFDNFLLNKIYQNLGS